MKKLVIGLALVALLLMPLAACGAADKITEGTSSADMATADEGGEWAGSSPNYDYDDYEYEESTSTALDSTAEERLIVRTGNMSLVVEDITQSIEDITTMSSGLGGYVVSSYIYGEEEEMRGWISFRVPEDKFDTALEQLHDMAVRVDSESTYSEDVTEEYIDLQARLDNAEATEQQYLALLDEADDVEDLLNIYDYLSRIRSEIEQLKGRIQYLEQTTSTSLIEVSLEPEEAVVGTGWSAWEVLKSAARGLVTAGKVLGTIAIWLLIFIPIWGTVLGIILWRRHKKKKAAK